MTRELSWYVRRARRMSAQELVGRGTDQARQLVWARRQVLPGGAAGLPPNLLGDRRFPTPLAPERRQQVPEEAAEALVAAARRLLDGDWEVLGTPRPDAADPDWFLDPVTGTRAPQEALAFRIDHRDEAVTGNVKTVWELSRHHHLTVLAAAWWLTGEDRFAETVDRQLRSWWSANPFLSGVHWTSGIELGIRLVSWTWVRRLLHDWTKVEDLFDANEDALRQIWWHQQYLAVFRSRGSSANNHAIAEECGRLVAACAFPWYAESAAWREDAAANLERELAANTFESGVNRELATDYHRFVTELGLVAAAEATAAGQQLDAETWRLLAASLDTAASMLDATGRPPRQGDGDEGRALVLDEPGTDPWGLLLDLGATLVGARPWWPERTGSVAATAVGGLVPSHRPLLHRPSEAVRTFPDAGITLLRTPPEDGPEIWCRCDGGPHGFLSIAAHGHADALSVEVRHGGVEILVDPGTYCYHGEPEWRRYFRSTLAHNTIEIDGQDQSVQGGPFLWTDHARTTVTQVATGDVAEQIWVAHHTGYTRLDPRLRHERIVTLDRGARRLEIVDTLDCQGPHDLRLLFHLGPDLDVELDGSRARLAWTRDGSPVTAEMRLPDVLTWSAHRGETDPVLGWHSPRFGVRVPITTLVGAGRLTGALELGSGLVLP